MKYLILGVVFVAVPYMLLSAFVMPALESLQHVYGNADGISEQVTQGDTIVSQQQTYRIILPKTQ